MFSKRIISAVAGVVMLAIPASALAHRHDEGRGGNYNNSWHNNNSWHSQGNGWHQGWRDHHDWDDGYGRQWHPDRDRRPVWNNPPAAWNQRRYHDWDDYDRRDSQRAPWAWANHSSWDQDSAIPYSDQPPSFLNGAPNSRLLRQRDITALEINRLRARGDSRGAARLAGVMQNLNRRMRRQANGSAYYNNAPSSYYAPAPSQYSYNPNYNAYGSNQPYYQDPVGTAVNSMIAPLLGIR